MKEIELTQGQVALVDDEVFEVLNRYNWQAAWSDFTKSFKATIKDKDNITTDMARIILGCPKGMLIDHKDHNTLNNQRYNIRICTSKENNRNRRSLPGSASEYKGVTRDKSRSKWKASIGWRNHKNKKVTINLGRFETEIEAAEVYDKAARKYFKEFAYLNFP